jgi:hypothetical protein
MPGWLLLCAAFALLLGWYFAASWLMRRLGGRQD